MGGDEWLDLKNTKERKIFDLGERLGTNLKAIGHFCYDKAMPSVPEQKSDERLVIAVLLSGLQYYQIDGDTRMLHGGQGIRFLSGVTYSSGDFPEQRGEMIWFTIERPSDKGFSLPGFPADAAMEWWQKISNPSSFRRFPVSAELRASLPVMMEKVALPSSPMTSAEVNLAVGVCLMEIYRMIGVKLDDQISTGVSRVINWLDTNISVESLPMDELAEMAGLSESRFYSRFKEEVGLTPGDYSLRLKIMEAQKRLINGVRITDASFQLGFSSSQYFATVFKRYTCLSPTAWLAKQQSL